MSDAVAPFAPSAEGRSRLSNVVADRITDAILKQRLSPGTIIGMEPELMRQYGVSRATLREAIRQVEARGVARMRRGAGGGLAVAGTPVTIGAGTLATYFEFSAVTLAELIRARAELEATAAGMAAMRVDDDQIEALRKAIGGWAAMTDPIEARQRHFALREMIARLSGNAMLWLATSAFLRVTADLSSLLTGSPETVQQFIADQAAQKRSLVEAIVAGDAAGAAAMVREEGAEFLGSPTFARHLDFALPDLVLESGQIPSVQRPAEDKLGLTTALRLRRDIVAHEWKQGANIGTEQQLRERYGVSRGLLREALMLLEVNGIVRIQRGREGGIVVGRPDPSASIAAIAGHMRHMDLAETDLRNIAATIDILAAGSAANRLDPGHIDGLFQQMPQRPDYEATMSALYPPPERRSAELICDAIRAFKKSVGRPSRPQSKDGAHWRGLHEALLARDSALARRHMRGIWGRLD